MASSSSSSAGYGVRRRLRTASFDPFEGDFGLLDLFQEHLKSKEAGVGDKIASKVYNYKPLFSDDDEELCKAEVAMRRKREAEKKRQAEEKKRQAEERKREEEEIKWRKKKHDAIIKSIRKFDPKTKSLVWTRYPFELLSLDLNEESNYLPMRNTNRKYETECNMFESANFLTIKIVSSDVGFPINVYGTVIARDSLDNKCVYLFRCQRRDSQLIKSEDESLILIGPARGLRLIDFIFLELDLRIRGERGQDKKLCNGLLQIDGRQVYRLKKNEVTRLTLASWLSTVEVKYTIVEKAVEATVEIHVQPGYFCDKISAHTSGVLDEIVLYKCEAGSVFTSDVTSNIQLWRRVIAVCLTDKLIVTIESRGAAKCIDFTPALNGADVYESPFGEYHVKVTWSVI